MNSDQLPELTLYKPVVFIEDLPDEGIKQGQEGALLDFVTGKDGSEGCVIEVYDGPVVMVPKSVVQAVKVQHS